MDSYIICATPRTGSTLLCELLASTRIAGNPDSFFMSDLDPAWAEHWGLPKRVHADDAGYAAAYLKAAIRAGKGQTAIFGLRLMRRDLEGLLRLLGAAFPDLPSGRQHLKAAFGKILYIHLMREDRLAQAVSMVKAEQSGLWHAAPDGSELERLAPPAEPQYDFARIAAKVAELEQYDRAWLEWFDEQGIQPMRLAYESLSAAPAKAVAQVCQALGLPDPVAATLEPRVGKLADAVNQDWMRRYRLDLGTAAP